MQNEKANTMLPSSVWLNYGLGVSIAANVSAGGNIALLKSDMPSVNRKNR
jgi:hypothetical protein